MPNHLVSKSSSHRVAEAAEEIDEEGELEQGGNSQAEFDARYVPADGYYPGETTHLIAVDVADEKYLHSMTITVASRLSQHQLLYNSFYLGGFSGYHDNDGVEADVVFHVVDSGWLCNTETDRSGASE